MLFSSSCVVIIISYPLFILVPCLRYHIIPSSPHLVSYVYYFPLINYFPFCMCCMCSVVRGSSQDIGQRERSVISRALNYVLINDGTRLARLLTRYLRHRSIKTENNNERSLQATSNKQQQANSAITVVPIHEDGTTNCCIVVLYVSNKADGSIH